MLDLLTLFAATRLQGELKEGGGEEKASLVIREGGSDGGEEAGAAELLEQAAESVSDALGAVDSAIAAGFETLFGANAVAGSQASAPAVAVPTLAKAKVV
mmetsp:Transcript_78667/g.197648  ORF Transcript_78667/g.197648 Transcript_78667/m.197648 type:complete len:100 (-) Transcript_78667:75-374(-)